MQNFKLKNRMSVSLLLLLTALFVCFNPGYAFAGSARVHAKRSRTGNFQNHGVQNHDHAV